ncbi:MAG: hypothetical protein IPG92_18000 [Flavobacteriales bacterium]|nr:hypothetical protein [Flavobacteriales bacterium]
MVHCISVSEASGIALEDVWGVTVVHNSVLIGAGSAVTSAAFHHRGTQSAGQDAVVHNNLFANHAAGVAYQVDVPANVAAEDHNGLFTNGPKISMIAGNLIPDLSAHQSVTGMGANDADMDPVFPLQPDLHMNTCSSGFAGAYFSGVDSDLDGDARGNPVCDMGADEHSFSDTIQTPVIYLSSDSLPFTLSVGASFSQYDWSTGASTPTIQINAGGTYSCTVVDANGCAYTMNVLVVVDPGTGVFTSAASSVALFPVPVSNAMTIQGLAPGVRYEVLDGAAVLCCVDRAMAPAPRWMPRPSGTGCTFCAGWTKAPCACCGSLKTDQRAAHWSLHQLGCSARAGAGLFWSSPKDKSCTMHMRNSGAYAPTSVLFHHEALDPPFPVPGTGNPVAHGCTTSIAHRTATHQWMAHDEFEFRNGRGDGSFRDDVVATADGLRQDQPGTATGSQSVR